MIASKHVRLVLVPLVFFLCVVVASCSSHHTGGSSNPPGAEAKTAVVQPLPLPGPYAVACSNIVQDFSRVGAGEDVTDYWEGLPSDSGTPRYVTDLLADPGNTLTATVTAPQDSDLYGEFAGQEVKFVVLVCYPTTADNPRPGYPLNPPQSDLVLPHMQTGSEAPLFADASVRYPVVAFSHGYMGSPVSGDYFLAISIIASYGYVVIAPFHGDLRFSNLNINDLEDAIAVATHLDNFTALQALRPLSMSAALDLVLVHPQWKDHIDETRIGGFGVSMGGETMLLLGGAGLTTSYFDIGSSWKQVTRDPRIKAAVGYVPYFGQPILPAFGRDQEGLDGINLPFLGISGTADTTAPISEAETGISRLTGTRRLVALSGVKHEFDEASENDIFTWALTFLDAEVRGNQEAISRLSTMGSVEGGGDDSLLLY
jgi:predicted dienelactone hydrolase